MREHIIPDRKLALESNEDEKVRLNTDLQQASYGLMQEVILVCIRKLDWLKSQKEISESLLIKQKLDEATSRNIYADLKLFGCELKSKLEKTKIKKLQILRKRNHTPPSHSKTIPT